MSHRLACWCGIVSLVFGLPAAAWGQTRKNCCKPCGPTLTASSPNPGMPAIPKFNMPGSPGLQTPLGPGGFNTPITSRRGFQPNVPLLPQQNLQQQLAIQQNIQFQQGMMQQMQQQWMLQDMVKRQLLQFAIEAPTENLERELKNSNAFVRWAASVELNRRWKLEKSVPATTSPTTTVAKVETPTTSVRLRSATPAIVTRVDQSLALSVPMAADDRQDRLQSIIPKQ